MDLTNLSTGLVWIVAFVWITLVLIGFIYTARGAHIGNERFRLSLGFSIASIFFPPFCSVPIVLNVKP
jgi:hypothetical protein